MKKGTDTNQATALPKHSVSGPALTVLESSRREIDARKQLPGFEFLLNQSIKCRQQIQNCLCSMKIQTFFCESFIFRTVVIEEEHSITKLFDLVMGRFSFRGINPVLEVSTSRSVSLIGRSY